MIKEFQGEYRWLSNFWYVPVTLDGLEYMSVEHAYQSAKNDDPEWKLFCQKAYAMEVKLEGNKVDLIPDWDTKRVEIMRKLLVQKFNQEPFRTKLINTGNLEIWEGNRWHDIFWGIDLATGIGQNMLGKLIMEIREQIKQYEKDKIELAIRLKYGK